MFFDYISSATYRSNASAERRRRQHALLLRVVQTQHALRAQRIICCADAWRCRCGITAYAPSLGLRAVSRRALSSSEPALSSGTPVRRRMHARVSVRCVNAEHTRNEAVTVRAPRLCAVGHVHAPGARWLSNSVCGTSPRGVADAGSTCTPSPGERSCAG